jgi:phenylacetate-CoA ligase
MTEGFLRMLCDTRRARKHGTTAITERQRDRLAEMVAFARANSPYYRELYQDVPERVDDPTLLPVTSKKDLMDHFDDVVTDREVTLEKVRAFVDDPDLIGERFLDTYTVATTSGTTGMRGVFLQDDRALAVTKALFVRMVSDWLSIGDGARIVANGGRLAMVHATGGHFASATAAARLRKGSWLRHRQIQVFPVETPLSELVAQLNRFQPTIVTPYASMAALLADEQDAGRLRIDPTLMVLAAEGLPPSEYDRIATVFNTTVRDSYAATECPFISYRCEHGWLHVNSDWVVVEPVDADYQPVPPGEQSHTALVSNLANRIQPILRYDLGDSILQRPDPCPCGSPLPAIRVQGRAADVLTFPTTGEESVTIAPLAFGALVDRIPGVELFQIVQTAPTSVRVRFRGAAGTDPDRVWQAIHSDITGLLTKHDLDHVTIERAEEPPERSPGGKFRRIIPLNG